MPRQKLTDEERLARGQERTRRWRAKKAEESVKQETIEAASSRLGDEQTFEGLLILIICQFLKAFGTYC